MNISKYFYILNVNRMLLILVMNIDNSFKNNLF